VRTISFAEFMEVALYDPARGFYGANGAAGRRVDFLTSVEVGPLFGAVIARAIDSWWDGLGRPDPFIVVEAGAGRGYLAESILGASPRCADALRYAAVERSVRLRDAHPAGVTSLADLPAEPFAGVILCNELLDNLAFALVERSDDGWMEVRVGQDEEGTLVEQLESAEAHLSALAAQLAPGAPAGGRIPIQAEAGGWVAQALDLLVRGRLVVIDYAVPSTAELASRPWTEWLRTYTAHRRGGHPLEAPGHQDITTEVCVDQLALAARPPDRDRSQAAFLRAHGIDEFWDDARRRWHAGAAKGDLEAFRARSAISEAAALTDPASLGGFRVLEWVQR
jgi:SAM-dependent MidA family methyltransferase